MFLDRVIHFGETLGDQAKGRSPKKQESLIEIPNVVYVKVHVLRFFMILISSQKFVITQSYTFRNICGSAVKGPFPEGAQTIDGVSNGTRLEVLVFRLNMDLLCFTEGIPCMSYSISVKFGGSGKGSFTEKAKIVDRDSLCNAPDSTGSKFEYEPYLFSVACS